ncbi:protein N-lysine methyltransferase METTL21A-like [Triticum dicoccoides]|nr:protein N-lysine methyltransferase METTL21A-like [Triticum dicoccoides]XP_044456175.1 protein N-lysine methyltransferase METTL21A-like [Triticum aestivum]
MAAAATATAAAACSSNVSVSDATNASPSNTPAISSASDSDSDSEDLRLLLPNLLPASAAAAAAPSSEGQLHQFHLPALPSPITVRTIPSLGLTFQLWPSATTLLRFLPASPHLLPRPPTAHCPLSIMELGSGTGAAGLALAAALPAHTVLSDLPAALPNLRHNASLNAPLLDSRGGSVSVVPLPWGDAAAMGAVVAPAPASRFDLVVASDVVYYEELVDPLIETLRFFVKGDVVFLMAHMRRWKRTDKKFFGKARKVFDIEVLHKDPPPEGWRHGPVVYRFTAKKQRDKK